MAETILVTGATGTVGSEVIKQLFRQNRHYHQGGRFDFNTLYRLRLKRGRQKGPRIYILKLS